jgi:hypothetical protein
MFELYRGVVLKEELLGGFILFGECLIENKPMS